MFSKLSMLYCAKDLFAFQATIKSVLKLWEKLYASFIRLSAMVVNVEPNIACEEFVGRILSAIDERHLEVLGILLCESLCEHLNVFSVCCKNNVACFSLGG
jgi:hypothetical protein